MTSPTSLSSGSSFSLFNLESRQSTGSAPNLQALRLPKADRISSKNVKLLPTPAQRDSSPSPIEALSKTFFAQLGVANTTPSRSLLGSHSSGTPISSAGTPTSSISLLQLSEAPSSPSGRDTEEGSGIFAEDEDLLTSVESPRRKPSPSAYLGLENSPPVQPSFITSNAPFLDLLGSSSSAQSAFRRVLPQGK